MQVLRELNMPTHRKIMILAGEASGDLQGAYLAQMIKKLDSSCMITGIGGPRMMREGVEVIHDSSAWGIIGPWHAIKKIPFLLNLVVQMKKTILDMRPDLLILIDTPAINMRLARFAKAHGIETLYFFPPSAWYPSAERAHRIAQSTDHIIPAFSYTVRTYENAGIKVHYFGHPLIDMIDRDSPREEVLKKLHLDNHREYIGILPGSREQEITSLMPVLLRTIGMLKKQRPRVEFLLPVACPSLRSLIMRSLRGSENEVKIVEGCSHEVMRVSRVMIMACGSASLEAAIVGTPMIILYRLAWPDWCIARLFIKVPFISLPNLILQRPVVPELLQTDANPSRISDMTLKLMDDSPERRKMTDDLREVLADLGERGVVERVGRYVVQLCEEKDRKLKEVG